MKRNIPGNGCRVPIQRQERKSAARVRKFTTPGALLRQPLQRNAKEVAVVSDIFDLAAVEDRNPFATQLLPVQIYAFLIQRHQYIYCLGDGAYLCFRGSDAEEAVTASHPGFVVLVGEDVITATTQRPSQDVAYGLYFPAPPYLPP